MKKTVLIFGASSFLGSNLVEFLKQDYRVVGTYHKTPFEVPGVTALPCDILKKDIVTRVVGLVKPDIAIYAIGMHSAHDCHEEPKLADALNTTGLVNACSSSERYGSKFIYISSAFVLAGEKIRYKEGDTPLPTTILGNSVASSEFYVQKSCLNYFILRAPMLYGRSFNPKRFNFFERLESSLTFGNSIHMDDSIHSGFLDVYIIAKIMKFVIETNLTNRLLQICSKDQMTLYEFAQLYGKIFEQDVANVMRGKWEFPHEQSLLRGNKASDELYFELDTTNLEETFGIQMPTVEESLILTKKRLNRREVAAT